MSELPMPIQRRLAAAAKYKPSTIQLLLVAEAPPCTLDRYFYFDSVDKQDSLFRYVWQGITGEHAGEREHKPIQLAAFRDAGVFLIDLHEKNISKPSPTILRACVPDLIKRARALNPEKIILIKASVYDAAFTDLADAGLPVVDERIPFPGSGQQRKFLEAFTRALAS